MRRLVLLVAFVSASCSTTIDIPDGVFSCATAADCPDELECRADSFCYAVTDADADAGEDASVDGGSDGG